MTKVGVPVAPIARASSKLRCELGAEFVGQGRRGRAGRRARGGDRGLGRPAGGEQAVVERLEAAGLRRGEAGERRLLAVRPEHRIFAPDHLQAGILAQQPLDVGIGGAAIAAGIIEEFDEDDVAVGGARPGAVEGASRARRDAGATACAASRAAQPLHRLGQDLGILEQIGADEIAAGGAASRRRRSSDADQPAPSR